jgi:predicted ribosome quality control (RQC) complex YloA/Tae2 family protein
MQHLTLFHHVERLRGILDGARLHGAAGTGGEGVDLILQPAVGRRGVLRVDLRGDGVLLWGDPDALPAPPPAVASPLITLLTRRLNGARISDFWCCAADRIVIVVLERIRLSGRIEAYALVAELFGRPPALTLMSLADEVVLATTHPRPLGGAHAPPRLPGQLFRTLAPPPGRGWLAPFTARPGKLFEEEWRVRGDHPQALADALASKEAWAYRPPGGRFVASPLRLTQEGLEEAGPFHDLTAALLFCRAEQPAPVARGRDVKRLRRTQRRVGERLERARAANVAAVSAAADAEAWRRRGDALLCHLHELVPGQEATLPEPDLPKNLARVTADVPPNDQAQEAFRRYRRLRRTQAAATKRLAAIDTERAYLAEVRFFLDQADDPATVAAISEEIVAAGWTRAPAAPSRRRGAPPDHPPGVLSFAVDGWQLLVGRHARANDWLVRRKGRTDDFWLHAKDYPGAHVLVRNPERLAAPPDAVVNAAAGLAAQFSSGRQAGSVALYFTQVRHLRRGPGMRPGQVLVDRFREVSGDPQVGAALARGGPPEP